MQQPLKLFQLLYQLIFLFKPINYSILSHSFTEIVKCKNRAAKILTDSRKSVINH